MISISKTLLIGSKHRLCILDLFFPFSRSISTRTTDPIKSSFRVSYLINSCGLSPESALKASKLSNFKTPVKPDLALAFFKKHGFSQTQVTKLIRLVPQLLTSKLEEIYLPKLQFFYSKGFSVQDAATILSSYPGIFRRSLKNQLIPTFDIFSKFLQSEDKTVNAIKRYPSLFVFSFHRTVVPIIDILRNYGVPESNIRVLLVRQPRVFMMSGSEMFTEIIEEVKKMGFDPSKVSFLIAIHALRAMSKPTWERKVEVYKRWGWSHEEVLRAFRKNPWCMTHSEESISAKMDFLVNKMGWDPAVVARRPQFLSLSLEKRIIPRCSVLLELLSKGLIKKKYGVCRLLDSTEKVFLQHYVNCYEDYAPHLVKIYHEKLGGTK